MGKNIFKQGILDSPPDERDHVYENMCGIKKEDLLRSFINQHIYMKDQKNTMKCAGFSISYLMENIEQMRIDSKDIPMLSAQFIYYNSGNPNKNGTTIRDALDGLKKYGVCEERLCPVEGGDELASMKKPSKEAYEDAAKRKIDGYAQVSTLEGIMQGVVENGGVEVSMLYYAEMLKPQNGYIAKPSDSSTRMGNHAKVIVGYDLDHEVTLKGIKYKGIFIQLNSYGEEQGIFGIEYIPIDCMNWKGGRYEYSSDKIFREAWVIYDNTKILNNRFHYNNQPESVVVKPEPVSIALKTNSNQAVVNGVTQHLDTVPEAKEGTTFVPLRFVSKNLGCTVDFKMINGRSNVFIRDTTTARKVDIVINQKLGYVDGKEYTMLKPAYIDSNNRTMIPLRAVSEMLGCNVEWFKDGTIKIIR